MNENEAAEEVLRDVLGRVGLRVDRVVVSGDDVVIFGTGRVAPGRPPSHRGAEPVERNSADIRRAREQGKTREVRRLQCPTCGELVLVDPDVDACPACDSSLASVPAREIPTRLNVRLDGTALERGIPGLPGAPRFDIGAMARELPSVPAPAPGSFPGLNNATVPNVNLQPQPFAAYRSGIDSMPRADVDALQQLAAANPELAERLMPNRNVPAQEPED